ncbi:hypothetical protein MPTK1_1g21850 [Marchantia polymorpha subsp. ruderalis]|uniref:Uncharacterized protein n=2 Tax=Marchantia polymorpha TaxID=3197 RepID=A0AAF6ASV3_MARPO|nr:hypothetical protein MARPO_0001s0521 [Marchantia polymorpha]BBM99523.1 hypothetical protein Mp_1g21850 [Marchantia polymorpha subsp. ruderalis]|eukprot:PTQ50606.1 hypothetical protein MARPO_0001s0521 [Marchantia polymorpha]
MTDDDIPPAAPCSGSRAVCPTVAGPSRPDAAPGRAGCPMCCGWPVARAKSGALPFSAQTNAHGGTERSSRWAWHLGKEVPTHSDGMLGSWITAFRSASKNLGRGAVRGGVVQKSDLLGPRLWPFVELIVGDMLGRNS